jgi:hypothetical protein
MNDDEIDMDTRVFTKEPQYGAEVDKVRIKSI